MFAACLALGRLSRATEDLDSAPGALRPCGTQPRNECRFMLGDYNRTPPGLPRLLFEVHRAYAQNFTPKLPKNVFTSGQAAARAVAV
jgi:hypothetical protein